jgi:hypothetical protein
MNHPPSQGMRTVVAMVVPMGDDGCLYCPVSVCSFPLPLENWGGGVGGVDISIVSAAHAHLHIYIIVYQ